MKNISNAKIVLVILFVLTIFTTVLSFPSKWRLFELKYGYRTSCNTCHTEGGGTENNDYGMAYHRKGENLAAFSALENSDSDQDGFTNLDEIEAKSNPGDSRSTPGKPGNFLSEQEAQFIPKKLLEKLFSVPVSFTISYATLDSLKTKEFERLVGLKLTEDERVPTFYQAYSTGAAPNRIGTALLFFEMEHHKHLVGGLACDTTGKISKLAIFKQQVKKGLSLEAFTGQFVGKKSDSDFKVGQQVQPLPSYPTFSQKLTDYAKKSLFLINYYGLKS
ncbi:MAG: hypothetical protein A2142_08560 [candidate division Zixibacteria bacterium RBG_16_48_11]|nr:MAG: hypothetical protein A2142_08560 [candidate division Zixibacteria bacterium RBG_16_48_11]